MKRCLRFLLSLLLSVGLMISSVPLVAFADVNDFAVSSDSNAGLMTLNLTDDDYAVMPLSSVGTAVNTIDWNGAYVLLGIYDVDLGIQNTAYIAVKDYTDSGMSFTYTLDGTPWDDSKYKINRLGFVLGRDNIPSSGDYLFSWDVASQFSYTVSTANIWSLKLYDNAQRVTDAFSLSGYYDVSSGDFALLDYGVHLTSIDQFVPSFYIPSTDNLRNLDFTCRIGFVLSSGDYPSTVGPDSSADDYQSDVSSSISGISSSVDEMTGEISEVADAIDALRGAMEPHYDNVLTQLHHITEQLHAFWDQLYNMFYLPQYARLGEILDAIRNMESGLGGVVSDSSSAIQAKLQEVKTGIENRLQSVQEQITGGYDNSGITSENEELSGAVNELDQAEQEVLDDVNGYLEDFEYPSVEAIPGGILAALSFFGPFLQSVFGVMGDFNIIITFSLTMIFVLIIVGYHRIRA